MRDYFARHNAQQKCVKKMREYFATTFCNTKIKVKRDNFLRDQNAIQNKSNGYTYSINLSFSDMYDLSRFLRILLIATPIFLSWMYFSLS